MARARNIGYTTYIKYPTGKTDKYGRKKYSTESKKSGVIENTTYRDLKVKVYNKSKKDNKNPKQPNVYVKYGDRFSIRKTKTLESVTKTFNDGHKEITYFK